MRVLAPEIFRDGIFKSFDSTVNWVDGAIEIRVVRAQIPSGPVGTRYVLRDPYGDSPILHKFKRGGFTGPIPVGRFDCVHL